MEAPRVATVRRFSRVVTQRLGALNDEYLARPRPLGASRVLYEIGEAGADARTIRSRLGLDSGYLSRLLRRLEDEHLITVEHDADDRRVRVVRLTEAGRAERAELDRRSDELARTLLDHLDESQRGHLIDAMATIERLLTAQLVEIVPEDPTSEAARSCLQSYFTELDARFDDGFDPDMSIRAEAEDLVPPAGLLLVAWLDGHPVGCGALKFHGRQPAEIKRMWVSPSVRGLAMGRRILRELEHAAAEAGARTVRLETNQRLIEAIGLYRSSGYREVSAFNDEAYAHHWFEKELAGRHDDT
jgi:DNA-binding MarR family transcriptional regulator/GNAT superfamily N-acetyltransferase